MNLFLPYNCSRSIGTAHFPFIQIETSQTNTHSIYSFQSQKHNLQNSIQTNISQSQKIKVLHYKMCIMMLLRLSE